MTRRPCHLLPVAGVSLLLLVVLVVCPGSVDSSCAAAGRCCQGKDNDCRGTSNSLVEDLGLESVAAGVQRSASNRTKKACFCDSACIDIGDCCADYRHSCPPQDCVLAADWQSWSDCSVRCGVGMRQRNRRIVRSALNGGKLCDATVQKAICYGTHCKETRAHGNVEMREMAKLLPASLGEWRRSKLYNPNLDIRKNLFEKQNDLQNSLNRPSYCAVYELTHVKSSCNVVVLKNVAHQPWTLNMTRGVHVCAECQPTAMQTKLGGRCKGAGLHRRETQWMALGGVSGCHGSWIMKTKQEECRCSDDRMLNLILV
jgi:hypothetical protein